MAVYDLAIQKMTIENDLKNISALKDYAESNDCENSYKYFRTIEKDGCKFTSPDKVYWDISEIDHPIIALDRESRDNPKEENLGKTMFKFVTSFDGHAFRSNDPAYEKSVLLSELENLSEAEQEKKVKELEALFGFINGEKLSETSTKKFYPTACESPDEEGGERLVFCRSVKS